MPNILFIPSDHGGGRGHVSRCLYLAKKMLASGLRSGIVLEAKHYQEGPAAGLTTFLLDTRRERLYQYKIKKPHRAFNRLKTKLNKPPLFVEFSSLAYQVPRDGYLNDRIVRRRLNKLIDICGRFKPDILVGDTHFLTGLLGRSLDIPVLQITRQAGFPPAPEFCWWKDNLMHHEPDALAPFKHFIESYDMSNVHRAEDILRGDRYIIPAIRELEPVKRRGASVRYCGPLHEDASARRKIAFFDGENAYPKIYITIGGGASRGQERAFFDRLVEIFDKTEFKVLISTAGKVPAKQYKNRSANMVFADWVDGVSAIRHSDLVIYHGGYGTTMEILLAGKPAIVIPSHSEQEGNGHRLEQLKVGKTILPFDPANLQTLDYEWSYGSYSMKAAFELKLDKEMVIEAVSRLVYSDVYERLHPLSKKLRQTRDRLNLHKLIEF